LSGSHNQAPGSAGGIDKIILQRQLADLGVERLHINRLLSRSRLRFPEDARRAFQKLIFPLRDLVGLHVKLLGKLGSVFSPLMAAKATLALKVPYGSCADVCSSALLIPAILGCGRTEPPLNHMSQFAEPALS
jgi:hypothetical protein